MEWDFMNKILNSVLLAALLCSFAGFVKAEEEDTISQVTEEFIDAVDHSDFNLADEKLANGADINGANKGWTALDGGAFSGKLDAVKYLIDRNADIESGHSSDCQTPLSYAAEEGALEVVKHLVKAGACIESHKYGKTPLSYAAEKGKLEVVKYLVEAGAYIESGASDDKTPLDFAAEAGELEVVKYLVEAGAYIGSGDSDDYQTPRDLAVEENHQLVVDYFDSLTFLQRRFYKTRAVVKRHKILLASLSTAAVLAGGLRWWYARQHGVPFIPKFNWFGKQRISAMPKVTGPVIASTNVLPKFI